VLSTVAGLHVPVILFEDVPGSDGTDPPLQIVSDVPKVNVGVIFGLTVTVNVVLTAHCPAPGVKVYVAELVLLTVAGFHVPETPFDEVFGNEGTVPPEQTLSEVPKLNTGVVFDPTVTLNVALTAHWPAVGVNVYTPDVVLLTDEGPHVPVIPSIEEEASAGTVPPEHTDKEVPYVNVGVIFGFTLTVNVADVAHCPAVGVNV
jgi:hypothetical protein